MERGKKLVILNPARWQRRVLALRSAVSEIMRLHPDPRSVEPELERLVCEVRNKEVELPVAKQKHSGNWKWDSGNESNPSKSRTLQLQFLDKLSLPVLTGTKIEGEKRTSVGIALFDVLTGQVVNSGPEALTKVEIVALGKDINGDEGDNWSLEEFNSKIVREREGGKTLLTGNVYLDLKEGVGFMGDVCFRHTKCWMKRNEFRLGARTVDGSFGLRVREAKTESFVVEDRRGKLYQKHHPPSFLDAVWRLEKIGKDGTFRDRLRKENINTVKEFLTLLNINPERLKDILGMPAKIWNITVDHARTCKLDKRAYLYCSRTSQQTSVVFNIVGQLMGLLMEHQFIPVDKLSEIEKSNAQKLVVSAFQQWGQVVPVDDEASLMGGSQQLTYAHCPSTSTTPETPNGCNFEMTSHMFDNHSTNVSSLGGGNTLADFGLLGFEYLDNISAVDVESAGQDFVDEYLNMDNISGIPNVLLPSNSLITEIPDGNTFFTSQNLPKFGNPQLDASSHDIMSSIDSPWYANLLDDYESQSIDDISQRYEQTLTFASPVASTAVCDTESVIQAFCKCDHLQISDNHSSLQSHDTASAPRGDPLDDGNDVILAGSLDATMSKAQRRHLSKTNAQRRWRMLFSIMRWFSVRRNLAREMLSEETRKDPKASSQANIQSAVIDILFSVNKAKRRYLSKKDKAKRRWRMLFSLMRWFSVTRKVARITPFREMPKYLTPSPGDITSSIHSNGGMNRLSYDHPLIYPLFDMTQTISEDERSHVLESHCFVQSQNSESESSTNIPCIANDTHLACSPIVPVDKSHKRHLLKRNKAQRRWRMLFSVVRWFSVRRNVARKTSIHENPFAFNEWDDNGSLQPTHSTNCSYEEALPGQAMNSLICVGESMTLGFCNNGNSQFFDTHGSFQSQNSNQELQVSLHDTINDILLVHSRAVDTSKAQRRYLSKRNKAQRRWRMVFSVVRWFSVRRNAARRNHTIDLPRFY